MASNSQNGPTLDYFNEISRMHGKLYNSIMTPLWANHFSPNIMQNAAMFAN